MVVTSLVPNLATCHLCGASEDLCFLHLPWDTNTKRSVSADYHEVRARNHIPVPNTTFPIWEKGFWETHFFISLLLTDCSSLRQAIIYLRTLWRVYEAWLRVLSETEELICLIVFPGCIDDWRKPRGWGFGDIRGRWVCCLRLLSLWRTDESQ